MRYVGVGEENQEALLVFQVTEMGGLGWPDRTLCSEICAPNNSPSYRKPMKCVLHG